jgi:hypothetical protein
MYVIDVASVVAFCPWGILNNKSSVRNKLHTNKFHCFLRQTSKLAERASNAFRNSFLLIGISKYVMFLCTSFAISVFFAMNFFEIN